MRKLQYSQEEDIKHQQQKKQQQRQQQQQRHQWKRTKAVAAKSTNTDANKCHVTCQFLEALVFQGLRFQQLNRNSGSPQTLNPKP